MNIFELVLKTGGDISKLEKIKDEIMDRRTEFKRLFEASTDNEKAAVRNFLFRIFENNQFVWFFSSDPIN